MWNVLITKGTVLKASGFVVTIHVSVYWFEVFENNKSHVFELETMESVWAVDIITVTLCIENLISYSNQYNRKYIYTRLRMEFSTLSNIENKSV